MPNHVTNILKASPEVLAGLVRNYTHDEVCEINAREDRAVESSAARLMEYTPKYVSVDDKIIDFSTVLPAPKDDDPIYTASKTDYGNGMVGWSFDGFSPMDWSREHWGTKWNAYSQTIEDDTLRFDTAWSHPTPVIEALSKKFPEDEITVQFADEDLGSNCGEYIIKNGEIIQETSLGDYRDPDTLDFASQICHGKSYADLRKEWDEDEDED